MKIVITLTLSGLLIIISYVSLSQTNQTGLKGMVAVPIAEVMDSDEIGIGLQTNAGQYKFIINSNRKPPYNSEQAYFVNLGFLPRLNFLLAVVRDVDKSDTIRQGIGDRSIQISGLLLKETTFKPSLVLNVADPFFSSNQYQNTNHVVASKRIRIATKQEITASLGYGFPYYLIWRGQENRELVKTDNTFLTNFFWGIQWSYNEQIYSSFEHDGQKLNLGSGLLLFEKLSLEFNLLGLKYPALGINFTGKIR